MERKIYHKLVHLQFRNFKKTRPWVFLLLVMVIVSGAFMWWQKERSLRHAPVVVAPAPQPMARRAIDGVWEPVGTSDAYPVAVVIENSIDARPTSGIAAANLVFEAPAEAGITRFLAVYADGTSVPKIGPVRSARPYYVEWAQEFGALFAHVGGSPEALAEIPSRGVHDLNQFWNGDYFWRSTDREAPHNVYTSTDLLAQAIKKQNLETPSYASWQYKNDGPTPCDMCDKRDEININFSSPAYAVTWKYDPTRNDYVRWQMGKEYHDADGALVRAKNVVVMVTNITITDAVGRRRVKTLGDDDAWVFCDGLAISATWSRESLRKQTSFVDVHNAPIALDAGTTWIEVVGAPRWLTLAPKSQ